MMYVDGFGIVHEVESRIYDEEEIHPNCTVQVWRNSITGDESWGWYDNVDDGEGEDE